MNSMVRRVLVIVGALAIAGLFWALWTAVIGDRDARIEDGVYSDGRVSETVEPVEVIGIWPEPGDCVSSPVVFEVETSRSLQASEFVVIYLQDVNGPLQLSGYAGQPIVIGNELCDGEFTWCAVVGHRHAEIARSEELPITFSRH